MNIKYLTDYVDLTGKHNVKASWEGFNAYLRLVK